MTIRVAVPMMRVAAKTVSCSFLSWPVPYGCRSFLCYNLSTMSKTISYSTRELQGVFFEVVSYVKENFPFSSKTTQVQWVVKVEKEWSKRSDNIKNESQFFNFLELQIASLQNFHTRLGKYRTKIWYAPKSLQIRNINKQLHLFSKNIYLGELLEIDNTKVADVLRLQKNRIGSLSKNHRRNQAAKFILLSRSKQPIQLQYRRNSKKTVIKKNRFHVISQVIDTTPRVFFPRKDIMVLVVPSWVQTENVIKGLEHSVEVLRKKKINRLIIDLRGNGGGNANVAAWFAGHFLQKRTIFGKVQERIPAQSLKYRKRTLYVNPQHSYIGSELVILTSVETLSTSEYFVAGLKDNKRAITIGTTTGGASGNPKKETFELNGSSFELWVATWEYFRPNGHALEGKGIKPNLTIEPTLHDVLRKKDPVLHAALHVDKVT